MIAISNGAGVSAQIMQAIDELSRDLRREHRDNALHEADRALQEGLSEASEMREQASSQLTGALVNGSLTALSGGAQVAATLSMKVDSPTESLADDLGAADPDAFHELAHADINPGLTPHELAHASANPGVTDLDAMLNTVRGPEDAVRGLDAARGAAAAPGAGISAADAFKAHNERAELLARSAGTAGQLGGIARDVAESFARKHEANAREHSARAQAANRRADAEQSAMQDAQKSSEKARDLHLQIITLEHTSRMAILKG